MKKKEEKAQQAASFFSKGAIDLPTLLFASWHDYSMAAWLAE